MASKVQRQRLISEVIAGSSVTSQPQLLKLLQKRGIIATQATVSRDLEEIGAVKVRSSSGESEYAIPDFEPNRIAPVDQLRRVLSEWVAEVQVSSPIVIVRTPPGCAHVVASALDRSRLEGVAGTVAGDDTLFCVASESYGAPRLAREIEKLAGIGGRGKVR
jgi:transcriptional regulator of arginine metabolism